jgi:hypothetical protein
MKRRTVVAFASLHAGVVVSTTMLGGSPAVAATPCQGPGPPIIALNSGDSVFAVAP